MKNLLVLTPSRRGVHALTRTCIAALEREGAERLDLTGCSDVALARNLLLTQALTVPSERDMLLLVDDDMSFSLDQAKAVIASATLSCTPTSACYATNAGSLAHTRRKGGRWNSGLGFLALPRVVLAALAAELTELPAINGSKIKPFCQCRPSPDGSEWFSEDYWFTEQLGGVELLSVAVAHIKEMPIRPDAYTLAHLNDGAEPC